MSNSVHNGYCHHDNHGVSWKHKTHRADDDMSPVVAGTTATTSNTAPVEEDLPVQE